MRHGRQVQRKLDSDPSSSALQIDIPHRDAGFFGVPHKEMVFLQPCTDCLVNLTERPPFVLSLDDIEVCAPAALRPFDLQRTGSVSRA